MCDSYFELSLKGQTRSTRGYGQFLALSSDTFLPKNFQDDFLKNDENKKRLNSFLAEKVIDKDFGDMPVVISVNNDILLNTRYQEVLKLDDLRNACSRHEETDIKIIPHVRNCADNGYQEVLIKTADTDVIVLLLAHIPFASNPGLNIEVDFGFGNARTFYDVSKIASNIPPENRLGLLFFFAVTASDYTSYFYRISKSAWWNLWLSCDFADHVFKKLSWTPLEVTEQDFEIIEKFICAAYGNQDKFHIQEVNQLRYLIFCQLPDNNLRKLPPSKEALRRHILRSTYVGGWVWGSVLSEGHFST